MNNEHPRPGTLSVWAGENEYLLQGATQVPVVHSVSFGYNDVEQWLRVALGQESGHIYGRNTNPTVHAFEEKIRILEGAQATTSAATGMGIISSTLFSSKSLIFLHIVFLSQFNSFIFGKRGHISFPARTPVSVPSP